MGGKNAQLLFFIEYPFSTEVQWIMDDVLLWLHHITHNSLLVHALLTLLISFNPIPDWQLNPSQLTLLSKQLFVQMHPSLGYKLHSNILLKPGKTNLKSQAQWIKTLWQYWSFCISQKPNCFQAGLPTRMFQIRQAGLWLALSREEPKQMSSDQCLNLNHFLTVLWFLT